MSISINQQEFALKLLQQNLRIDGRKSIQSRITKAQFLKKPGHLLYSIGSTTVLIKISAEITGPKPERPSEGFVVFRVDCQCCLSTFQMNKKLSVEISKLLESIVIGSNALDPESLCIVTGKYVWKLIIDVVVVNDDGNVIDCVLNGVVIGLMDMKKPMANPEKNKITIKEDKLQMLSLAHVPISMSFGLIENNIFQDPSGIEERVSLTRITVTMNIYKQLCSIHKPGGMGITEQILSGTLKIMEENIKQLTQQFRSIVKERRSAYDF